ncbi:hypothetical protein EV188_11225 [Actinomycetospora succinea]|uniref:Uncharacterized protein n=1 Tax=Actinomycetospora succinea TaxID=663603 RepID=A0A4R6UR52_9PSEU|nr:DUF6247 family protein [Actinomycetospora succinea]TDQ47755.1 hypothetical protein EV188_11225 [Actinomycetospora succinea]
MTLTITVERSGPAIRAALAKHRPEEGAAFEAEFREALDRARDTFDLAPVEAVLDRWWGIAAIRANPLTDAEKEQVAGVGRGDVDGLLARDDQGNWIRM